jgi:hypothetical protein
MPTRLRTEITIAATPERVWRELTDFAAYPEWNPFITSASGRVAAGERLTMRMQPEGGRPLTIRPTVRAAVPDRHLRWLGRLGLPGLFDGEHSFTIEPIDGDGVRLIHEEQFRGVLVPLLNGMLHRTTLPAFESMNRALKERAER